jgi:hypothetical protein
VGAAGSPGTVTDAVFVYADDPAAFTAFTRYEYAVLAVTVAST